MSKLQTSFGAPAFDRSFWAAFVFGFVVGLANIARAQDCSTEAEATAASSCVVMRRGEARGVWFSLQAADTLRREHLELPELRLQAERWTMLNNVSEARITLYQETARERAEALALVVAQLDTASERERLAREELHAWYREPILWFVIGLAVSAIGVLIGAAAL